MFENAKNAGRVKPLLEKTASDSRLWKMPDFRLSEKPLTIAFLNQHGVNTALQNPAFNTFLLRSDYLLRDGIGIKLALKLFGLGETENLNGTDLITAIIHHYKNEKLAIFGASDETIRACRARLEHEGVQNIVAAENGFHDNDFYIKLCEQTKPDIIILCMGMPRQELLAVRLNETISKGLIVCGGGWADFYSGLKQRAPLWMRRLSLEWLHRLASEPKRLGKRYTVDILYYFYVLALARFKRT